MITAPSASRVPHARQRSGPKPLLQAVVDRAADHVRGERLAANMQDAEPDGGQEDAPLPPRQPPEQRDGPAQGRGAGVVEGEGTHEEQRYVPVLTAIEPFSVTSDARTDLPRAPTTLTA